MIFLTGKEIIDSALTLIKNNSTPVRTKMLIWLNIIAVKIQTERDWTFFDNGVFIVTPTSNVITCPSDYGGFISISGDDFILTGKNRLTTAETWETDSLTNATVPLGFTEGTTTQGSVIVRIITLHGQLVTTAITLSYTIEPSVFTDDTTITAWPRQCLPLFQRSLLDAFYEMDFDERASISLQLNAAELSRLKKWDNTLRAKGQIEPQGYTRRR